MRTEQAFQFILKNKLFTLRLTRNSDQTMLPKRITQTHSAQNIETKFSTISNKNERNFQSINKWRIYKFKQIDLMNLRIRKKRRASRKGTYFSWRGACSRWSYGHRLRWCCGPRPSTCQARSPSLASSRLHIDTYIHVKIPNSEKTLTKFHIFKTIAIVAKIRVEKKLTLVADHSAVESFSDGINQNWIRVSFRKRREE